MMQAGAFTLSGGFDHGFYVGMKQWLIALDDNINDDHCWAYTC